MIFSPQAAATKASCVAVSAQRAEKKTLTDFRRNYAFQKGQLKL
jgi:hypothetical protein